VIPAGAPSPVGGPRRAGLAARAVWALARALVRVFYRVERAGGDVPDGPALLVANHANGLLDPAIVVSTSRRTPRFLAKSTLFAMPVVGGLVRQVGAIPVHRRIDASADPSKNDEMFAAVRSALAAGDAVCLFPEGISHSSGRLEPLKTGAARIALGAAREGVPVRVVPVGLNFDDKAVFRSAVVVAYGPPLEVGHRVDAFDRDSVSAVRDVTADIAAHLRDVLVEADPVADAEVVDRVERVYAAARRLDSTPGAVLERRRLIAKGLGAVRRRDPDRYTVLFETLVRYERRRRRFGLTEDAIQRSIPLGAVIRFVVREVILALLLVPILAAGVAVFALPYHLVELVSDRVRTTLDQQATVKIAVGFVVHGLWVAGIASIAGGRSGVVWGLALAAALVLLALAAIVALEREAEVARLVGGYVAARLTRPDTEGRLLRQRAALADVLDATHRWLQETPDPPAADPPRAS
jgi:glycerol-3-phosphate O-acyltransferase/dihydroxyacetone phosphate acyltransferase